MKMMDINAKFTEKVMHYLNDGWVINSESMSGHQGEIAKIDVVKGKVLIRIWLEKESSYSFESDRYAGNRVVLRVGKCDHDATESRWSTVWTSKLSTIEETIFYEIDRNEWYVDTLEEAMNIQDLHNSRRDRRYELRSSIDEDITSKETQEIAGNYLKRAKGYQRLSWDDIKIRKRVRKNERTKYVIFYHGNTYYL